MNLRSSKPGSDEPAGTSNTAAASTTNETAATAASAASAAAAAPQAVAPDAPPAPAAKPEKAVSEPDETPAIPRDEFHGHGGAYALVGGKRVPIDDQGKPLPAKK